MNPLPVPLPGLSHSSAVQTIRLIVQHELYVCIVREGSGIRYIKTMKKNKDVPIVDVSFRITIDLINESELKRDYRSAQSELWFSAGFQPNTYQTLIYTITYGL